MENNTHKKSKAGIITFIAVLLLLVVVYVLFTHKDQIFTTKSSVATKTFAPLDNSQGQKGVTAIDNSQSTTGAGQTTQNQAQGTSSGSAIGNFVRSFFGGGGSTTVNTPANTTTDVTAGNGLGATTGAGTDTGFDSTTYGSDLTPLPTPDGTSTTITQNTATPECADGVDNNNNGLIDIKDPACHTDFDATNVTSYDPTINNESRALAGGAATTQSQCPSDDPLVFTADEQSQLQDLLTQYYLIAPTLKSADDIDALSTDIASDQAVIDQAVELTRECISEKADPSYTGPQAIKDNPYYRNPAGSADTYLPAQTSPWIQANLNPTNVTDFLQNYGDFEKKFNIW